MKASALLLLACLCPSLFAGDLATATKLYDQTDYEGVLRLVGKSPNSAPEWALAGKAHFMKADYKKASETFEKATLLDSGSSEYFLWLGRSYGRRAETASPFTAPGLASKSRQAFEKSVVLNPRNKEALNDLFEYYLQAPGFLGGGDDKAKALIDKIAKLDPAERYFAEARLAEQHKEWKTAEDHLRHAVEAAPKQAGRVIDLAKFLARQGRIQESEVAFRRAEKIAPDSPQLLFERAQTYIEGKRNLDTAKVLLERYLKSPLTPNDPPRYEAEKLLRQVGGV